MKKVRMAVIVALVALLSFAWVTRISSTISSSTAIAKNTSEADELVKKKLYQKAISLYESTLKIKEDKTVRDKLINAYELGYKDTVVSEKDFVRALGNACENYPKDSHYWEVLLSHYVDAGEFKKANSSYNQSLQSGASSEELMKLGKQIVYSYKSKSKTYTEFYRSPNGYFTFFDGRNWTYADSEGNKLSDVNYLLISPISSNDEGLFVTSEVGPRIVDSENIVQYLLNNQDIEKSVKLLAYGEQRIPVLSDNGKWKYYNCDKNTYEQNEYDAVSSFQNGIAFVRENEKWICINTANEKVSETAFEDIKLFSNGEFMSDDIFVASQNGNYGLYNDKLNNICNFDATDADLYLGDLIAFKNKDNKWGFINEKGNVVIEPQYVKAKSFSNGLAAVYNGKYWGFIDKSNQLVIEYQYLDADYFTEDGVCMVSSDKGQYNIILLINGGI